MTTDYTAVRPLVMAARFGQTGSEIEEHKITLFDCGCADQFWRNEAGAPRICKHIEEALTIHAPLINKGMTNLLVKSGTTPGQWYPVTIMTCDCGGITYRKDGTFSLCKGASLLYPDHVGWRAAA